MDRTSRILMGVVVGVLGLATVAEANVEERYAELQQVSEAINDPNPIMRLAQLEAILAEGDATKVQLALRTAFTVDDPNVRALALRAHFASFKTLVIEAQYPEVPKEAPDAGTTDRRMKATAEFLDGVGQRISLLTNYESPSQTEMTFISLNNNERREASVSGTGNIRGTTITFSGSVRYYGTNSAGCSFEFPQYEGFVIHGTGSCQMSGGSIPFPVSLRLF